MSRFLELTISFNDDMANLRINTARSSRRTFSVISFLQQLTLLLDSHAPLMFEQDCDELDMSALPATWDTMYCRSLRSCAVSDGQILAHCHASFGIPQLRFFHQLALTIRGHIKERRSNIQHYCLLCACLID